jgi:hypothetical protein
MSTYATLGMCQSTTAQNYFCCDPLIMLASWALLHPGKKIVSIKLKLTLFGSEAISHSFSPFQYLHGTSYRDLFFFFFSKSRDLLCTRNLQHTVHTIRKSTSSMPDSAEIQEREMQIHVSSSTFFFSIKKKQKTKKQLYTSIETLLYIHKNKK